MGKKLNEKNEENEQRMRWRLKPANANNPHKRTQRRSARALVCNRRPALIAHLQECSMPGRKISSNHLGTHKASSAVAATEEMGAVRCIRNQSDISTICAVLCLSRFFRIFLLPFALEWFRVIAFFFFWCPDYMFSYIKMRSKKNPRRIAIFNFVWFIHEPYLIVLFFEFVFFFNSRYLGSLPFALSILPLFKNQTKTTPKNYSKFSFGVWVSKFLLVSRVSRKTSVVVLVPAILPTAIAEDWWAYAIYIYSLWYTLYTY